jgi:hypothetical protein
MFLYWLASTNSYKDQMNVPKSTAVRICHKLLNNMVRIAHMIIQLPKQHELHTIGSNFEVLAENLCFWLN